ncbi:MAG: NACHT domain-containing protein, partial [Cyanobacteriota bacterium]
PQQKDDFSPEHFQVQASTEYETPIEHGKFLAQVLETGDSLKNRDKKIAVIGEPGAGKTTLLQEIAKEVEGAGGLPIFVRLANLGEKALKDYLLEDWLEEATGKRRISDDIQDDFVQQFNLDRVWLLLDGVDEIAATGNLLSSIEKQLKGWVADARIVLTCRLNVWDVGKNDLYAFEKYRIQQLSYPDLVGDFIRRFFSKAGEPTKGEKLIEKLERSQQRIRDLVKNPLRLTLLCRTWKRRQGELPQTKAELYKRFVETFYEWKDKPEIDQEKRPRLEQALGEMAKNAIDKETTKFRLRESFVRQELDKFDKSLFDLACRVSWINNVGVAAENPDEPVYAFFHPTFQEYFAALAIDDWDFFLPRAHDNHNPKPVSERYRIFEPQWKEVILLWLGRDEVEDKKKEAFIYELETFKDKCGEVYSLRSYFLAAASITEFKSYSRADEIVSQTIRWGFSEFRLITEKAIAALQETDPTKVIKALNKLLITEQNVFVHYQVAFWLGLNNLDKFIAISTLIKLIDESDNISFSVLCIHTLGRMSADNSDVTNLLTELLDPRHEEEIILASAKSLLAIDSGNLDAVKSLIILLKTKQPGHTFNQAALILAESGTDNQEALKVFAELLHRNHSQYTRLIAAWSLGRKKLINADIINTLIELIYTSSGFQIWEQLTLSLVQIGAANPKLRDVLKTELDQTEDDFARLLITLVLLEINPNNFEYLAPPIELACPELKEIQYVGTKRLIPKDISIPIKTSYIYAAINVRDIKATKSLTQLLRTSQNIASLTKLLQCQDESFRSQIAEIVVKIDPNNSQATIALTELLDSQNEIICQRAAEVLLEISPSNLDAIAALIKLLHSAKDKNVLTWAAMSLKKITHSGSLQAAVKKLRYFLLDEKYKTDSEHKKHWIDVIWHCAENMTYPDFYQAWHQQEEVGKITTSDSQSLNQADLPQSLHSAIANDPQLSQIIHLIGIDSSKFIDPNNPAAKLYTEMVKRGCPKCDDGTPKTMAELQIYWDLLEIEFDKRVVLVFYASSTDITSAKDTALPCPYSETFLSDLSKFGDRICVVTNQPFDHIPLKFFTPSQAIAHLLDWIRTI